MRINFLKLCSYKLLCITACYRYWERTPNLKVSDFRRDLDRHSIFSGRNILELVSRIIFHITTCISLLFIY